MSAAYVTESGYKEVYWYNKVDGLRFAGDTVQYNLSPYKGVVDSGWSCFDMPLANYNFIMEKLLAGVAYTRDA